MFFFVCQSDLHNILFILSAIILDIRSYSFHTIWIITCGAEIIFVRTATHFFNGIRSLKIRYIRFSDLISYAVHFSNYIQIYSFNSIYIDIVTCWIVLVVDKAEYFSE